MKDVLRMAVKSLMPRSSHLARIDSLGISCWVGPDYGRKAQLLENIAVELWWWRRDRRPDEAKKKRGKFRIGGRPRQGKMHRINRIRVLVSFPHQTHGGVLEAEPGRASLVHPDSSMPAYIDPAGRRVLQAVGLFSPSLRYRQNVVAYSLRRLHSFFGGLRGLPYRQGDPCVPCNVNQCRCGCTSGDFVPTDHHFRHCVLHQLVSGSMAMLHPEYLDIL